MKRFSATILATALVLSLATTSAFAAPGRGNAAGGKAGCAFVDANNDGICDARGEGCTFVDADKDGICDNCPNGGTRPQDGTGRQSGRGRGRGCK